MLAAIITIAIIEQSDRFTLYARAGVGLPLGIISALRAPNRKKFSIKSRLCFSFLSFAYLHGRKNKEKVSFILQL